MFKRKSGDQIELLSVHIPKTAGTSFRYTLFEVYGEDAVLRVDLMPKRQADPEDPFAPLQSRLKRRVKVLHGHYNPVELREVYPGIPQDVKMITWVRNPVTRVISNYYYLRQRIREEIEENTTLNVGVTNRMLKTLMEYAVQEIARNRMSKFLEGISLDQFAFIGVQENYSEDLRSLAVALGWGKYTEYLHNVTEDKYSDIDEATRAEIRALNSLDWEIYQEVLALSAERKLAGELSAGL
jgi:hypothetical protein